MKKLEDVLYQIEKKIRVFSFLSKKASEELVEWRQTMTLKANICLTFV